MGEYFHSVRLDESKCKGCTNCIKKCPTEAIRVRKSKARITDERCIDCGECIRVCPYHAKRAITDSIEEINEFKYKIAIPAPAIYPQFKNNFTREDILTAVKRLGFDEVLEVSMAADIVSLKTRELIDKGEYNKPLISSACPAVVALIKVMFPNLVDNILKFDPPFEIAATLARKTAVGKTGLKPEEIGVFFISPCAAKVTWVKSPVGKDKSQINGVLSITDLYLKILSNLHNNDKADKFDLSSFEGIRWANSGGEALSSGTENFLAVDGIANVIKIFEEIENDNIEGIDFVEALACPSGCIGGPLTVENVYTAKMRMKKIIADAKNIKNSQINIDLVGDITWGNSIEYKPIMKLDENMSVAMQKIEDMEVIFNGLPGLDCGACGSPTCHALAEDIVRGIANETDCIFKLRDKVRELAREMMDLEAKMPPVMDKEVDVKLEDKV